MLGIIGAVVFGAVFAGSWMVAEDREQEARKNARKTPNYPYYYDKNGRLRNAYTGRKYSTQDALNELERKRKERADREEEERKRKEAHDTLYRTKYYGVIYYNNSKEAKIFGLSETKIGKIELFKTYDDAKVFIYNCYKKAGINDELRIKLRFPDEFSESRIDRDKDYFEIHYNF